MRDVSVSDETLSATIELGFPCESAHETIRSDIDAALRAERGLKAGDIELKTRITRHGVQRNLKPIPGVKNLIAIASGKGGVGKTTVAANLALALSAEGASEGVLDADIYGPSQPQMRGVEGKVPESRDGKTMLPLRAHGLQIALHSVPGYARSQLDFPGLHALLLAQRGVDITQDGFTRTFAGKSQVYRGVQGLIVHAMVAHTRDFAQRAPDDG